MHSQQKSIKTFMTEIKAADFRSEDTLKQAE